MKYFKNQMIGNNQELTQLDPTSRCQIRRQKTHEFTEVHLRHAR